jgi:hypothetical protein
MKMTTCLLIAAPILCCMVAFADDDDRGKLMGSWQTDQDGSSWTFTAEGASLRVTQTEGGSKIAEFACNVDGKACETKISGKKVAVTMWFNGPKLVLLETKGSDVMERKFAPDAKGDGMQVEVVPMVPAGKTETLTFKRSPVASAKR